MPLVAEFSDFFPGITALLGVLVGGLITYRLEEVREKNARTRAEEEDATIARAFARLGAEEFRRVSALLAAYAGSEGVEWWTDDLASWGRLPDESRLILARHLSEAEWDTLVDARTSIDLIAARRKMELANDKPVPDGYDEVLTKTSREALAAALALEQMTGRLDTAALTRLEAANSAE